MPNEELRKRAAELIAQESKYRLPILARYFLFGVVTGVAGCALMLSHY